MRLFMLLLSCLIGTGCVQVDDGSGPVNPGPAVVPDVIPDGGGANIDQQFLAKIVADPALTKPVCMRYAALYRAFAQSFRERNDIPVMVLLKSCFKTSSQFIETENAVVAAELKKLEQAEKSREALAAEFDRMSEAFRAAALKK